MPFLVNYKNALTQQQPEESLRTAAIDDYLIASRFCRAAYNFYESRAKCAHSWKLGIGVGGGIFGFLGSMMIAAGTGGAAPGIAAGLAGVSSVTLTNVEKGPLDTSAYESRRVATKKSIDTAEASIRSENTPRGIYNAAALMMATCSTADTTDK